MNDTLQLSIPAWLSDGLNNGAVFNGRITGFTDFGAFINDNGVDGMLRESDFSVDHCHGKHAAARPRLCAQAALPIEMYGELPVFANGKPVLHSVAERVPTGRIRFF